MKKTNSMLRIVESEIDAAFESAKVSFTTPIPVLTVVPQAEGSAPLPTVGAPEPYEIEVSAVSESKTSEAPEVTEVTEDTEVTESQVTAAPLALVAAAVLPATSGVPTADTQPGKSLVGRLFALSLITATLAGLTWVGVQVYYVITDGWVAPLHLSPDSDQIQSLRMAHQRHLDELSRIDAEVARLDGEIGAIDSAIARLSALRGNSSEMMKWQAETSRVEAGGLAAASGIMKRQYGLLQGLHARQIELVTRARADLAAGLVDRTAVDREEQARDQLALEMTDLERQIGEASIKRRQTSSALRALRAGTGDGNAPTIGRMPEVAAGDERDARIEVEIERLRAEARGHRALRSAAVASLATQRTLLAEVESRPLHRAMKAATDVAFIPYTQLASVHAGARVLDCTWGVFSCHTVGRVGEILSGEVVTQDPWGEMARGQYAVLVLDDKDAVRERILRVRP